MSIPATPRHAVARTLKALKKHRDLTDDVIAARSGLTRQKVQSKISGARGCDAEDFFALAQALEVPPYVLLMPKGDAIRWCLDNPLPSGPDGGPVIDLRTYACTRRTPDEPVGRSDHLPIAA